MKTVEQDRLEAKLKLWETPGFGQFLVDLARYMDNAFVPDLADSLKNIYRSELNKIEETGKLKQGKLDL